MRTLGIVGGSAAERGRAVDRLVAGLAARGLTVSVMRRAADGFDPDRPGKDSRRHRDAGAGETMVASSARFTLLHEGAAGVDAVLARLAPVDVVLLDGLPGADAEVDAAGDVAAALARLGIAR